MPTITFTKLQEIDQVVGRIYRENEAIKKTKFKYAYDKFFKQNFQVIREEMMEEITDARIDFALEDEKTKEVMTDDTEGGRGFKYSKDGLRKVLEAERKILKEYDEKEYEAKPYISAFVPEELTEEDRELLKDLVI